jgi:hypothetical protein
VRRPARGRSCRPALCVSPDGGFPHSDADGHSDPLFSHCHRNSHIISFTHADQESNSVADPHQHAHVQTGPDPNTDPHVLADPHRNHGANPYPGWLAPVRKLARPTPASFALIRIGLPTTVGLSLQRQKSAERPFFTPVPLLNT